MVTSFRTGINRESWITLRRCSSRSGRRCSAASRPHARPDSGPSRQLPGSMCPMRTRRASGRGNRQLWVEIGHRRRYHLGMGQEPQSSNDEGRGAKSCALIIAILAGLAIIPSIPLALISPMGLDGGGTFVDHVVVYTLFVSPLLLLVACISAALCYRNYTAVRMALAVVPLAIVGTVLLMLNR